MIFSAEKKSVQIKLLLNLRYLNDMRKVVIIDDEAAGRQLIREYLSEFKELILLGEANNGVDAVKLIYQKVDVLIFSRILLSL